MFLRKILFLTSLTLYEILTFVNSQEYLKDLHPKDIKLNINDELPPVEIPRPILLHRHARSHDTDFGDNLEDENRRQRSQRPTLIDIALQASVREGLNAMKRLYSVVEPDMVKNGHVLQDNHPAALLSKFSAPVVDSKRREMAAYATLTAAKAFRKNYDSSNDLARQAHTQRVSLRRTALESLCPPRDPPTCMPASERYRTHDGTCNNKRRLRWGAAQMPFNRFLPPEYGDGVDSTRSSVDGGPLSSSRFVSLLVHGARDGEASLTLMLAQWGQLLDHDLTSTAQPRSINGSVPSCCGNKDFHPSCFPIKVPLDDPWLSPLKVRCLEFLRSAPAQRRDCILSWREQTNQATSYIDASPIYSSSVKSSDNARVFRKGLLIFGRGNPADDVCQRGAIATHCIRSGDGRSGEQPGLLALHHVWVHEHNDIARKLSEMNLHWSDEKIYQETRRIIGAMFQHITYREFLPIVLGREVVKLFELELLNTGYFEGYDPKTNPTVANAFAAAAFRFGHSLVQNSYIRCDRFHNVMNNNVSLHEEFQRGDIGSVGSLHRLIRGMASQRALKRDEFITPELTNHLFQTPGFPFGLDLAAINIQRGRDHGVPPYTHWRVPCGLTPITTWEEFANVVGPESAKRISHAYHSVHDIDLFVGGIAERPVVGGLVGPTFACIIAQQFSNSRKGDRFWYENAGFESSFTPAQLHAIRRVSLASVLCRAVGGGTFQPHIFLPPEFPNNVRLPCGALPLGDFDINPWLEQDPFGPLTTRPLQQQPPSPTFKPQLQPVPDRIFDIMELETKSPVISDTPISDNKVGFSNRIPPIQTNIKDTPSITHKPIQIAHVEFVSNALAGIQHVKNTTRISDKLDIKLKGIQGHVTKQKPVPGVNSKLDKNNRKGVNRHGIIQTTTRRTIIVNNIPIELRNTAGIDKKPNTETATAALEPRIGDSELTTETSTDKDEIDRLNTIAETGTNNTNQQKGMPEVEQTKEIKQSQIKCIQTVEKTLTLEGRTRDIEKYPEETDKSKLTEIHLKLQREQTDNITDDIEIPKQLEAVNDSKLTEVHLKVQTGQRTDVTVNLEERTDGIKLLELDKQINKTLNDLKSKERPKMTVKNREDRITFSKLDSAATDTNIKIESKSESITVPINLKETRNSDLSSVKLKNITLTETSPERNDDQKILLTSKPTIALLQTNDSDIDPMIHTTPSDHKRVQRKMTSMEHIPKNFKATENVHNFDLKKSRLNDDSDNDLTRASTSSEHKRVQSELTSSATALTLLTNLNLYETTPIEPDPKRNDDHYTTTDIGSKIDTTSSQHKLVQRTIVFPEQLTTNQTNLTQSDLKRNGVHKDDSQIDSMINILAETYPKKNVNHQKDPDLKSMIDLRPLDHKRFLRKLTPSATIQQLPTTAKLTETTHINTDLKRNDDHDYDSEIELARLQRKLPPPTTLEQLPTNTKLTESTLTEIVLKRNDDPDYDSEIELTRLQRKLPPPTTLEQLPTNTKLTESTLTEIDLKRNDDPDYDSEIELTRLQRKLPPPFTVEQLPTDIKLTESTLTETDLKRNEDDKYDSEIERTRVQQKFTPTTTKEQLLTSENLTETILTKAGLKRNDIHKTDSDVEHKRVQHKLTPPATMEQLSTNLKLIEKTLTEAHIDSMIDSVPQDYKCGLTALATSTNVKLGKATLTETDLKQNDSPIDSITYLTPFEHKQQQSKLTFLPTVEQQSTNIKTTKALQTENNLKRKDGHKNDFEIDSMTHLTDLKQVRIKRKLALAALINQQSTNVKSSEITLTETDPKRNMNHKTDPDIDPMIHSTHLEHKRVQRKLTTPPTTRTLSNNKKQKKNLTETNLNRNNNHKNDSDSMIHLTPLANKSVQRKRTFPATTEQLKDKSKFSALANIAKSNNSLITTNRTLTTKTPRPSRITLRNVELRQYQNRPSYTKPPQKVIVDSINGDNQYEIEINIRQTNKSPKPVHSTPHVVDYTNGYKTNQYERYTPNYQSYTTTTPIYAYYQPIPTQISSLTQNHKTKPPTIIFLNEHEQHRTTTTRQPGFIHSIVSWNSHNRRPLPQSINGEANDRPGYEEVISSPHSTAVVAPAYQRPPSQVTAPGSLSSFSQAQLGGGIVQASSSAISNGNFGSIAGFASANGADSTFSFNIRPKPDKNQIIRPESSGEGMAGSYGLTKPQHNPWYTRKPEYISLPIATNEQISPPYRENGLSPFSTSNSQTYYIRNKTGPQRKESLTLAHSQEFTDYDYTSRILQPLHNLTDSEEKDDVDIDYEYNEDYGTSSILKKFNQDGYLRPEHMIDTVLKTKDDKTQLTTENSTLTVTNNQILDDNYVLPVLNNTKDLPVDLPKPLNKNFSIEFSDSIGKHLSTDIFSEDLNDSEDSRRPDKTINPQKLKPKRNRNNNRNHQKIAFAPINVLTKPERPDNWVIYETPKEEPLLPQIPELTMDPLPSVEVPKPIQENSWLDLTNLKRKLALQFMKSSEKVKKDQNNIQVKLDTKTFNPNETIPIKTGSSSISTTNFNTEHLTDTTEPSISLTRDTVRATNTDDLNYETVTELTADSYREIETESSTTLD